MIEAELYTLAVPDEDRFLPVPINSERNKKYAIAHPVFVLRSQAKEYRDEGVKQGIWKVVPKVVKVKMIEL